jgi:Helix-turn-helix domain
VSVVVMQWVWQNSGSQNGARLVLLAIADCCNKDDGTGAWPSNAELSSKTKLSERAVQNGVKALERSGELKVEWGCGRGGTNRYTVVMESVIPAESAPFRDTPQDVHPAESAPPPENEKSQASGTNPAESAPPGGRGTPADSAANPAESAHGTVKNRKSTTSTKKTRPRIKDIPRPDVDEICNYLADKIEKRGSMRPPINDEWRKDARLLLDERRPIQPTVERIKSVIDWCQDDSFWHQNVLSMPTLRRQYDRLRLGSLANYNRNKAGNRLQGQNTRDGSVDWDDPELLEFK